MKYTILLVLLFFQTNSFGQIDSVANAKNKTEILNFLKAGNLNALNRYFEGKSNAKSLIEFRDRCVEAVPGYFAGTITFAYEKQLDVNSTQYYATTGIEVIAKDSILIYWKFDYSSRDDTINVHIDSFINCQELSNVKNTFQNIYKTPLHTAYLFDVYGTFSNGLVGEGGIYRDDWKKILAVVNKKDVNTLQKKLRSGRIYDQLYAVAGFAELKKRKYPIDKETDEIIKQIRSKKGSVMVMQGCILHEMKISEVVTEMIKWH